MADGKRLLEKLASKTQVKEAVLQNMTGRDNRTPFVGQTQFPTEGSKAKSKGLHDASVEVAEVGPAPLTRELDKTKTIPLKEVMPKMPTAKGSLPIVKTAQERLRNDPLVQYLRKHAQQLESNVDKMLEGEDVEPLQERASDFVGTPAEEKMKEQNELLKKLFTNHDSTAPSL